jgi:hypothetical protein
MTPLVAAACLATTLITAAEQAPPATPPVAEQAFRLDPATGTLAPLEQAKEKGQERTGWSEYRYIDGARSTVTLPGDLPLQFVIRVDGNARTLQDRRSVCHYVEQLSVGEGRRYRTKSLVRLEQEYSEIVPGLDPKKPKNGTLRVALRAPGPLPPGEYVIALHVCSADRPGIGPQYGAFRVAAARQ